MWPVSINLTAVSTPVRRSDFDESNRNKAMDRNDQQALPLARKYQWCKMIPTISLQLVKLLHYSSGITPPPSPQKIAPPNSQARIQGPPGAKRALAPPYKILDSPMLFQMYKRLSLGVHTNTPTHNNTRFDAM